VQKKAGGGETANASAKTNTTTAIATRTKFCATGADGGK